MADRPNYHTLESVRFPRAVSRGFFSGVKAYLAVAFGTALVVELGRLAGFLDASAPVLNPSFFVFWVYSLHASLGGYATGQAGSLTVVFGVVLFVVLAGFGYSTARQSDPLTVAPSVAYGSTVAVGYFPLLLASHLISVVTVPAVAPAEADSIRLLFDVGALFPVVIGGLGGFLYAWWSLPAGSSDV